MLSKERPLTRKGGRGGVGWEGIPCKTRQLWFKWRWFPPSFTRCKSSSLLIYKIRLNLGNQGWRLTSKTDTSEYDTIFVYMWKWFLEVIITSSVSMYFERSPFLDFFTLTWFSLVAIDLSIKNQNKRGIVRLLLRCCVGRGVLQNKFGFINWVHSVNWPTKRNFKDEVLSVRPSS